jgi:putative tryptophan/tyrosine transport system substrate-binding protein
MRRREFIAGLGAAAWPLAARAQEQEPNRMRRIGVLMGYENDLEANRWLSGFTQVLSEWGWTVGRNIHMDVRWGGEGIDRNSTFAKALVLLQPDVILSSGTTATAALQGATPTIPIVFVIVGNPVEQGIVASIPRPGGNLTGFMFQEPVMAGKMLELLTEIAPSVKRAVFMFNPDTAPYIESYYLPSFEAAAGVLNVTAIVAAVHNDAEIETVLASIGGELGGGLVVGPDRFTVIHRAWIISLAARHNVPAVYSAEFNVREGGLLSYGPDFFDEFRRAAIYVDRVLRGTKPAELPVQLPVKYETALNIKTAKTLGLEVPPSVLLSADEVIE